MGRGGVDELGALIPFGETELGKPEAETPQQSDSGLSGRR